MGIATFTGTNLATILTQYPVQARLLVRLSSIGASMTLKINLALLWKQGWPIRTNTHKTADFKVVDLLAAQGTRLVAIDNVHVILTASGVARRDTLDAFRFLMSAGNVPLVVAGLDVARQIFADAADVERSHIAQHPPVHGSSPL